MLRSSKELIGYRLAAKDGPVGKVKDLLIDEPHWAVRWLVADTGDHKPHRKVLISPVALGEPDWQSRLLPVRQTKAEIEAAPALETDATVSREYEKQWFDRYGLPYYRDGAGVWGVADYPGQLFSRREKQAALHGSPEAREEKLRSMQEIDDYRVHATDGDIGHVEEFVIDDKAWVVRYAVVDTRKWLPGRRVLIAPNWIASISWADRTVAVELTRDAVKDSPEYRPTEPVNREYEARLYDYYGRPVYWE